jgi:hypothetical protein
VSETLLLWLATSPPRTELLEAKGSSIRLVHCTLAEVSAHALVPDGLIAVVDDDHVATEALEAVVDEVVRQGDLTGETLAHAAEAAAVRARSRVRVARDSGPRVDEADAMETLLEWITIEFVACMSGAVLEGELLEGNVQKLLARQGPEMITSEHALYAGDTLEMLETVRESFRRMQEVLHAVRVLSGSDISSSVALGPLCQALSRVLQSRAVPVADVVLEADATCATSTRPGKLVAALVLLANDVLDRAAQGASARGKRVRITLRAHTVDGAAAVEMEHDLDAAPADARTRGSPLPYVRRMLRGDGAEVQVTSAPGKTLIRLRLPLAELSAAVLPDLVRPARGSRTH